MENPIRFSFLIPFWNLDYWMLQRMIDSIPHRRDVEILLLDNASDTIDREHMPGRDDARVRIIFQSERLSLGYCRNELMAQAQGEWIIFADADDRFITDELERLMDMPETAGYDLIYWGMQTVWPDGRVMEDSMGYQGKVIQPMPTKDYALAHKYESSHKMVRRQLLVSHPEIKFDEIPILEDGAFSVRLLLGTDRIGVYPPMVFQYLRRDSSTLGKTWPAEVMEEVLRHVYATLDDLLLHHYSILEQESTKVCLIRLKQASLWRFFCMLFKEWRRYGWALFYRDLVGAGFETYEKNLLRAMINRLRVIAGGIVHKK